MTSIYDKWINTVEKYSQLNKYQNEPTFFIN